MTRAGRKLIDDFILPALNDGRYGNLLRWVDKPKGQFALHWSHKNAAKWTLADTIVFQDWDKLKGHYQPHLKSYYMQAKQRFRAALYKLSTVTQLTSEIKQEKRYQLHLENLEKKRSNGSNRKPKKEESQRSIPTSVIRKNTSYIGNLSEQALPESDEELQKVRREYTLCQQKQMKSKQAKNDNQIAISPMREINSAGHQRHIPIQPLPVYNTMIPFYDNNKRFDDPNQMRFQSPNILLVKTYADESKKAEDDLHVGCVHRSDIEPEDYDDALNLCKTANNATR